MKTFLENLNKYWVTPFVAIVGGLLGLYFSVVKSSLEKQAGNLQNTALRIETELKQKEFNNELKLHMYTEVKNAIEKDDKKLQSAVLLIVNELLADDSLFRNKLIYLLQSSPNTSDSVKKEIRIIEKKVDNFYSEQDLKVQDKFTIDVFYLEDDIKESQPAARELRNYLAQIYPGFNVRLRLLPRSINARSGYRISANEIRYDPEEETLANKCLQLIKAKGIFKIEQPNLRQTTKVTPNYLSMFVRGS